MKIKLNNIYCGPRGTFPAGTVLATPDDIPNDEAMQLLDGSYAHAVKDASEIETMTAPEPETAETVQQKKRPGRPRKNA